MASSPAAVSAKLLQWWSELSWSMKAALGIMLAGALAAVAVATSSWGRPADPTMVPLLGGHDFSLEGRDSAIKAFRAANLSDFAIVDRKVLVPRERQADYLAALATADAGLPGRTDEAIDKYIEEQRSWWASTAESMRLFHIAEQRRLARVVESFPEIDHASVIVSQPEERGTIRARTRRATAAVKVTTVDGAPLAPQRIEQIKELVDGAFVEIPGPENVKVVEDALRAAGGAGASGGPDPALLSQDAGRYLMTKAAFEMQVENKIRELFADLRGLLVKVNAELDPRHGRKQRVDVKEKGPLRRESSESSTTETAASAFAGGGEPGVRTNVDVPGQTPNLGASAAPSTPANVSNHESIDREFDNIVTLTDQNFVDFEPVKIGVVVRYRVPAPPGPGQAAQGDPGPGPTPQQIQEMIASLGYPGLTVDSVAVQPYVGVEPPPVEIPQPSSLEIAARWLPSVGYLLVGSAAIVAAIFLARRAPLPTLAQPVETAAAAGASPDGAAAQDPVIPIPKDEAALRFDRLQEQVAKMVQANPDAAAAFVKRWIHDPDS
jgi:flagellar biosynthesis/type III secretory pathway M-ring protein FliF/YscJ